MFQSSARVDVEAKEDLETLNPVNEYEPTNWCRKPLPDFFAHNEWFKAQVQVGIDQIERGEFIDEEEMDARVERLLQS